MPTRLNYTSRDYAALLQELQAQARTIFPDWTDYNEGNAGNALLSALALLGDILNYNQDVQFNESFLDTARYRRSVISLCKLLGYKLASAQAAVAQMTATVPANSGGVTIPKGTKIYTVGLSAVRVFEFQADLTIPASATTGTAFARHAETKTATFTGTGAPDQKLALPTGPYLDGSATVTVDGAAWNEVDNFVVADAGSQVFTVEVDEDDKATITFGDSINGAIPPPAAALDVSWAVGGGLIGNVPANTLRLLDIAFTDDLGAGVSVTVTNLLGATGGVERESIETARKNAPFRLKGTDRTVTKEDHEQNALVTGVVRALAVTAAEYPTLLPRTTGVFVIPTPTVDTGVSGPVPNMKEQVPPTNGELPSTAVKDAVRNELLFNKPVVIGQDVLVLDPQYKIVTLNVQIVGKPNLTSGDRTALENEVFVVLKRWFDPERTDVDDPWVGKFLWAKTGAPSQNWGMTVYQSNLLALLFRDPKNRVVTASFTLPPPAAPALSNSGTGNTTTSGAKYFVLTYTNANGETTKGPQATLSITAGNQITVTAPAWPVNVVACKVYEGTVSGGPYYLKGTINTSAGVLVVTSEPNTGQPQPPAANSADSPVDTICAALEFPVLGSFQVVVT